MNHTFEQLDAALRAHVEAEKLPGVSVSINGPDGVIFERGYGYGDMEKTKPIDEHTIFGIASMSKSMTTLALCMLAAEGALSFSDPVSKYFPSFDMPGTPKEAVQLHHLAMHTAGIPPMEPLEWSIAMNSEEREGEWITEVRKTAPNKMETIEQIIDYIALGKYGSLGAPGEQMSYSNEGYAILSYIVDKCTGGQSLEQFLDERVFAPLGMTRTVLDLQGERAYPMSGGNMTSLFEDDDHGNLYCDDVWSNLPPFRGCACVKSTAHDMSRYYKAISGYGVIDGQRVISSAAIELLVGRGFGLTEKPIYCYGLNKRKIGEHTVCEHSGGLHGVSTHGGLFLGEHLGFAALCNKSNQDADRICWILYNFVMKRPLDTPLRWLHESENSFSAPQMLIGKFISNEGVPAVVEVYLKDGVPVVHTKMRGECTLKYCGDTWFHAYQQDGVRPAMRLEFLIRNGTAWGLRVGTRIYSRIEE